MHEPLPHLDDFHLAQSCVEGRESAIEHLQQRYRQPTRAFLMKSGASETEAQEIVEQLWADCVAPVREGRARLASYNGTCSLQTWLRTVALNKLLTHKRRDARWAQLIPHRLGDSAAEESPGLESETNYPLREEQLIKLMRSAVERAFLECPAENFVLLQLIHGDELKLSEVAKMLGCSVATASRHLERAARELQAATLVHLKAGDPWLEPHWEDFLELCRSMTPSCLGVAETS